MSIARRNTIPVLRFVSLVATALGNNPLPIERSEEIFGFQGQWFFLNFDVMFTALVDNFFTCKQAESFVVMQNGS